MAAAAAAGEEMIVVVVVVVVRPLSALIGRVVITVAALLYNKLRVNLIIFVSYGSSPGMKLAVFHEFIEFW